MIKRGKKYNNAADAVSKTDVFSLDSALDAVTKTAWAKFDETISADFVLGIDPAKGEQAVRGSVLLPNGTGKTVRVAVFAKGDAAESAKSAGADFVGAEDLVEKITGGWMEFDVAVATPDLMGMVGKVARVLGPKGLLPNKKIGTVTLDVAQVVEDLKKGRVSFRNDKGGGLHVLFGKVSFGSAKLKENLSSLLDAVRASKPASSKGKFLKKIVISSSMGIGFSVNPDGS
jgi:large subunit ribosomal protein L1